MVDFPFPVTVLFADFRVLKIPMIAPFFGCTFGGFLYDLLIFTGQSPINSPYMGFYRFLPGLSVDEHDQGLALAQSREPKEENPV